MQRFLRFFFVAVLFGGGVWFFIHGQIRKKTSEKTSFPQEQDERMILDKNQLRAKLTHEQYHIIVEKGTEIPFSSPLTHEERPGTYVAVDTGKPVFRSEDKFDSGTGWPSFTKPITPDAIQITDDYSLFEKRTEVLSTESGHLGHVFSDGPPPTGLRYCINGLALRFIPDTEN